MWLATDSTLRVCAPFQMSYKCWRKRVAVPNHERPLTQPRKLAVAVSAIAVLLVAVVIAPWRPLAAQPTQDDIAFDVASIRRNTSGSTSGGSGPTLGGRYTFINTTVRSIIALAYGVRTGRVLNGPSWVAVDRYDVNAIGKADATDAERAQMLKRLLRDRFGLVVRAEQRMFPVYSLVLMRADGPAGTGIRPAAADCSNAEARKKALAAAAADRLVCGFREGEGTIQAGGIQMPAAAELLGIAAGRPVFDKTGVSGSFDFELKWRGTPDIVAADGVDLFTAVQEQLGLRLISDEAPLDVIVIEKIERPSDN